MKRKEGMSSVLDAVRVIDFGQYIAGPLTAMLLADQGAGVIRVDPPGGPLWDTPANATWNRGKRSITLHLKQPDDQEGLTDIDRLMGDPQVRAAHLRRARELFKTRTAQDWEDLVARAGSECAVCRTSAEWFGHPHARASQMGLEPAPGA
jgi:crotonobetainyl-CoA:carnitine CoA-transferase CaiB-like acyl-CoA transferase